MAKEKETESKNGSEESAEGKRLDGGISEFIKRTLLAGVGAVFMTEEGIRSMLGDMKLPKEAVQFALTQVARTKEEMFKAVAGEIRTFLESTRLADELRHLLTNISLEISTKVRFVDEAKGVQPRASATVKVRKEKKKSEDEA